MKTIAAKVGVGPDRVTEWEQSGRLTMAIGRRALDIGLVDRNEFLGFCGDYRRQADRRPGEKVGGGFWNSRNVRIGRRFGAAVVRAAKEGRLPYREAYALTGLRGDAFRDWADRLDATT